MGIEAVTAEETQATGFDVELYTRIAQGPWRDTNAPKITRPDLANALAYVQTHVGNTAGWLAHVLVTRTHKEARITAFLSTWAYEQHWLAAALGNLLIVPEVEDVAPVTYAHRHAPRLHLGPLREAIVANLYGRAVTGVQMTERLVDNLVLDAMLGRLAERVPAGAQATITHVRETLARQRVFFTETATTELLTSRTTQRLARYRLRRRRFPLPVTAEMWAETSLIFADLFGGDHAWAQAVDVQIDALPGMRGLHLVSRTAR